MVKVQDVIPKNSKGSINTDKWLHRVLPGVKWSDPKVTLLQQSIAFAQQHTSFQQCFAKETFEHSLLVAESLSSLSLHPQILAATILYFPVSYNNVKLFEIREKFGFEIEGLLQGILTFEETVLKVDLSDASSLKNLRQLLLSVVNDPRSLLIKLAIALGQLRKAGNLSTEDSFKLARDCRDIYAPIANRLGIWQLKWELEDLSFRCLESESYKYIAKFLDERREARQAYIARVIAILQQKLTEHKLEANIVGRSKHIYSIWKKMQRKNISFKEINDARAIRVLVATIPDCYAVLGLVHALWQYIPKEFDDYIANPKKNNYRSLHTSVIGPEDRVLEVQIRTKAMNEEAELGVAAHWAYKEGIKSQVKLEDRLLSLKRVLFGQGDKLSVAQAKLLKDEALNPRVYVFSPKGKLVDLPQGATPLDFAYSIHTDVGHRCRGAKVDGRIVPLNYKLKSAEQVEILTVKEGGPSRDWLLADAGFLNSSRTRYKVHAWFQNLNKEKNIALGKDLLDKELNRLGIEHAVELDELADKLHFKAKDDLLAALGMGEIKLSKILSKLSFLAEDDDSIHLKRKTSLDSAEGINVRGMAGLKHYFAKCCMPVYGDSIIGYITKGRGVAVHTKDCVNVSSKEHIERLIDVDWGENSSVSLNKYLVNVELFAYNRPGLLKEISLVLSKANINVVSVSTYSQQDESSVFKLAIEVIDLNSLRKILVELLKISGIYKASRVGG